MSEVNIDAQLVAHTTETLVEMTNGCICCTLRDDLLKEIERLARENRFDYLLIESTGISEPLPVAATFAFETADGRTLSSFARLDTMATVVDGEAFLDTYVSARQLKDHDLQASPDDTRTLADLLTEQVEFADVLLISKIDRISGVALKRLKRILRAMNPEARIETMRDGDIPVDWILDTGRFDMRRAMAMPQWESEMRREHVPETEEYGVHSFVYRARRPFHPARLWDILRGETFVYVLRSKGTAWIASRVFLRAVWSKAGRFFGLGPGQAWWATVPPERWPGGATMERYLKTYWDDAVGDCRQEIVFIGIGLDESSIRRALDDCLLTDDEMRLGPDGWAAFDDPLPLW
jgi:G3E family GTPase